MKNLKHEIEAGRLPSPYELQLKDLGHYISPDFGVVTKADIGKLIYLKPFGISMENDEQMQRRKGREYGRT